MICLVFILYSSTIVSDTSLSASYFSPSYLKKSSVVKLKQEDVMLSNVEIDLKRENESPLK